MIGFKESSSDPKFETSFDKLKKKIITKHEGKLGLDDGTLLRLKSLEKI